MNKDAQHSKTLNNIVQLQQFSRQRMKTLPGTAEDTSSGATNSGLSSPTQHNSDAASNAFIILRMNDFDVMEETFGHSVANELSALLAIRLQRCLRPMDVLERIGNNEFAILILDIDSKAYIEKLLSQIEQRCNGEYVCSNLKLHTTVSAGISITPQYDSQFEEQLRYARIALRQALQKSNISYKFFSHEMLDDMQKRAGMIFELHQALKQQRFVLHYQPQYAVDTQQTVAVEALIRMKDNKGDLVYPDRFIDLAEESGLILPIGHWVIKKACQQFRRWRDLGCAPEHIAVNVSAKQLADNSLIKIVDTAINENGIEYNNLELEITEQSLIKKISMAEDVLKQLSAKGVRIALDDFGTGYSSLAYLAQLPLNVLKIDRSFLQQLENNNQKSAGLIKSIVYIAKELNMEVVAEGVENRTQQQYIKSAGCHYGQGYGYSRPQDVDIITSMLLPQAMQA